jgi:hypothetical protein
MVNLEHAVPWEITIINGTTEHPLPLGSREEVSAAFAESLPGVSLERPPIPPPEILDQMPPILREAVLRPKLEADFEQDDLSIQFYANDEQVLQWVNGEVRGEGDPVPALAALCLDRGWSVIDCTDKSIVDLRAGRNPAWERFRKWRDKAINQIRRDGA